MSFVDVFTVFSAIFGAWALYFQNRLKEKERTVSLIDTLIKHNYFQFYRYYLKNSLDSIDNHLGTPSWSLNSFVTNLSFHYLLAILYVFFVFFLLWFLGGENSIGTLEILPKKESYGERLLVISGLTFIAFLFYFLVSKKFETIDEEFQTKFHALLPQPLQEHRKLVQKLIIASGIFIITIYFKSLSFSIVLSIMWALLFDSLLMAMLVVVGVVVGVGGVSLIDGGNFLNSANTSILIFLLLIPLLNAILDFISLTLSRYFSRKILNENLFLILFHLILDFLFAVVSLILLLVALYYSIELFNAMIDKELQIPIYSMLDSTLKNPFSLENAWITFMLLSTLIPTLLHILLALISILLYVTRTTDWFITRIEESQKSENKRIETSALLAFPLTVLSFVLFYLLVYLPISWFIPAQ